MSAWKVIITAQAQLEIRGIQSYIANTLLMPETASKQTRRIIDGIKSLDEMPLRLPLYDKEPWHGRGLRKMIIDNFSVFALPNEKTKEVVVLHVFYSGRNTEKILH